METKQRATVTNTHRVVVRTKYHGPTNHRGSRISVTHGQGGKRIYVEWDYSLGLAENHCHAVQVYLDHMEWEGDWRAGADDTGYYAVKVA